MDIVILGRGYISGKIQKFWELPDVNIIQVSRSEYDYLSPFQFDNMVNKYKPSYIINTYGYTGKPNVDACEDNVMECYNRNYYDQISIHENSKHHNIPVITVSSGCIYNDETGERSFTEDDPHTFGDTNPTTSTYSKTKSKFDSWFANSEYSKKNYILRIRMPFCDLDDDKDYLGKILKYDKLVNYKNSVTYIPDLVLFIEEIIDRKDIPYGIYNIVNTYGINCEEIYAIAKNFTMVKYPKKWYTGDELLSMGIMKCRRSNCVLDNNKASQYCSFFDARTAVKIALEEHFEHNEK